MSSFGVGKKQRNQLQGAAGQELRERCWHCRRRERPPRHEAAEDEKALAELAVAINNSGASWGATLVDQENLDF